MHLDQSLAPDLKTSKPLKPTHSFQKKLWIYILLAYVLAYAGLFTSWMLIPKEESSTTLGSYYRIFFTVVGPTLAAIITCFRYEGAEKLRAILRRLKPRTSQVYAYVLIPLLSLLCAMLVFSLAGPDLASLLMATGREWQYLLGHILLQIFMVGILEETGWRGWMLPHLSKKYHLAKATMILAPVWCLWHFPKLLGTLAVSGPFLVLSFAASVILSFLWFQYQGNLLLLAVAHGSINFPIFFLEHLSEQAYVSGEELLLSWQLYAAGFALLALGIVLSKPKIWYAKS